MSLRRLIALAGVLFLCLVPAGAQAQAADIIRGRVTGPDDNPISGAIVTATSVSGNVSRRARTARDGRYTIAFPGGCLLYTSPSPRDRTRSRMPSSA